MAKERRIIAELSVVPLGVGPSVSRYVKAAITELKAASEVRVELGAMGTVLEADDMDELLGAVRRAHDAAFEAGAQRVVTTLRMDERRDKRLSIESKLESVES